MPHFNKLRCNRLYVGNSGTGYATQKLSSDGVDAGQSGTAGIVKSYPATAAKGYLALAGVANDGDTATTISNAAMGQASVISIPDPGAATANFVLTSAGNDGSVTTATNAEITRAADVSTRVVTLVATGSITEALHEGKVLSMAEVGGNANCTFTLPEATGGGGVYKFVVGVVMGSNTYKVAALTTDIIQGSLLMNQDSADTVVSFNAAADSDYIALDGTTTGGVAIGDWFELTDMLDATWVVTGSHLTGSGTEATPFGAT
jgi:hypothetical protein